MIAQENRVRDFTFNTGAVIILANRMDVFGPHRQNRVVASTNSGADLTRDRHALTITGHFNDPLSATIRLGHLGLEHVRDTDEVADIFVHGP